MNEVREGAVARLGILFERHHRRLYNFCLRLTGDRHLAEDLVQEVFARILKYRHTYRPDSDFLVWTYQMTRNVCADHFRRLARTAEAPGEPPIDIAGAEARPLDELESAEAVALLRRALSALPLDKRELLVLSRFQNLRYEQIAELLGCTVGAVKVRVHRAVKQLRDVYLRLAEVTP
jgi:RNA polymerase sigma-70 factor (ECF subfamily)